jgi:RHS repeat-associated protein
MWEAENRQGLYLLYDAEGRRVAKLGGTSLTSSPITAIYILGTGGEQLSELDGSLNWKHSDAYVGGKLLATYDSAGTHFHFTDWLGSRRLQVRADGSAAMQCVSLPFGEDMSCGQPNGFAASDADGTEHHFTGKERDIETGHDCFGARYYASNMGRFMSPDWSDTPSQIPYADLPNPQSLNLYSYVKNNPLSRTDADGHCDVDGEHHGWVWCAAHAIGITETAKETQTRLANEASGFIAANHIGLIYVNGQWQQPGAASNAQLVDWWNAYNKDNQDNIANGGRGLAFAGAAAGALTTPQARDLAKYLGFRPVNVDWDTHGQTVFEKNGRYISLDKDSHSGGVWKEFDRQGNRTGTLDAFLNKIGK